MRKYLVWLLVITMVLGMTACAPKQSTSSESSAPSKETTSLTEETASSENAPVLKIGFCMPLTGSSATSGKYAEMGAELGVKVINDQGGVEVNGTKYLFELVKEDNEGKSDVTVNAYNKLISDGVIAIVGPNSSAPLIAAGPSATAQKVPAIGTTASNPDCTSVGGEYVFRACWIDDYQGKVCAKMAQEILGASKVAILYSNADDYSSGLMQTFTSEFEAIGGEVVDCEAYAGADVKDFKAQLTAIQKSGAEVIFLPNQSAELPLQIQQIRELGLDMKIMGEMSWDNPLVTELAGAEAVEGCYFISLFAADSEEPIAQEYVKAFEAEYGELPNTQATMNYDSIMIIADALKRCGTVEDSEALRDAIAASDLDLPSGHLTYDENRNPNKSANIMIYHDGKANFVTSLNP